VTRPKTSAWLDGRLVPTDGPQLQLADRGFQLGDGLFETLRARRGVVIELDEHLARLGSGAATLQIPLPFGGAAIAAGVHAVLEANDLVDQGAADGPVGDASIRITVTRGPLDERGTLPRGWREARPTIAIQAWAYLPPSAATLQQGVRAVVSAIRRDPASPLAGVKTTSRADSVYARLEAERAGVDEALFLTTTGQVGEATSANLFAIRGGRVQTPPIAAGVLPGTTRTWLVTAPILSKLNLTIEECDLTIDDLCEADEAFLSSSVAGIVPLVEVDRRPIGSGRPGSRTHALREARERWVDQLSLGRSQGGAS
jgi:branched-chain amino acid aminotransferase